RESSSPFVRLTLGRRTEHQAIHIWRCDERPHRRRPASPRARTGPAGRTGRRTTPGGTATGPRRHGGHGRPPPTGPHHAGNAGRRPGRLPAGGGQGADSFPTTGIATISSSVPAAGRSRTGRTRELLVPEPPGVLAHRCPVRRRHRTGRQHGRRPAAG